MRVLRILMVLFLLIFHQRMVAQIGFYKQYSSNGYDYGYGICQTADTGYFVTGGSTSFTDGPSEMYLLKLDSLGDFQWSKHYGGNESDIGIRVKNIPGYGNYIAGYTNSFGNGAYDFMLLKTDEQGNELWHQTYGTSSWDRVFDAALTKDSGMIIVGETTHTLDGEPDIYILRTDKEGHELWNRQIGSNGPDLAKVIVADQDTTFIIGGQTYVSDSSMYKGWVARMDQNGTILWEKRLGKNGNCVVNDAVIDANGQIAVVGMVVRPQGDTLIFEGKALPTGYFGIETQAKLDGVVYYEGVAAFGSGDRYLTVQKFNNQYSYGGFDLSMAQNYSGLSWEMNIGQVNYLHDEWMGEVIHTKDDGAIVVGSITDSWMGGSNVFVFKYYFGQPFTNTNDDQTTNPLASVLETNWTEIGVYPNPFKDELWINSEDENGTQIHIYTLSGLLVMESAHEKKHPLDVSQLKEGSYLLVIQNQSQQIVGQTILTKY
jgi:hypothetical protein